MNYNLFYLNTFIPEVPKLLNANFDSFKRYIDVFYDETRGVVLKPVETTGRVKAAKGEFVTAIVDNLIVKKQYTNLYENITTADLDFVTIYNAVDVSTRLATSNSSTNVIWPLEPSAYSWVDINQPYYKIKNDVSIAFQTNNIGQEFQLIFSTDVSTIKPYNILVNVSTGGRQNLVVNSSDASKAWIKLIAISYDVSYGPHWVVKQYGGTFRLV
jgi:hypothetical protein